MKTVAVAVIHGMGSQLRGYSDPLGVAIAERLSDVGLDPDRVAWQEIFWQDITERRQREYLQDADSDNKLDYTELRTFIVQALGDAVAYRYVDAPGVYESVHRRIAESLGQLEHTHNLDAGTPLIVLAHSLGGHIISNYMWDMQHGRTLPGMTLSPFQRGESLSGLVTFGCNIPLFTFAFDRVQPIEFPPATLEEPHASRARWMNFFDPDDVLAYPLKPTCAEYDAIVSEDVEIDVGGLFSSWNPMSHTRYWRDKDLARPVANYLGEYL